MFLDFLKNRRGYIEVEPQNGSSKSRKLLIILIIGAILILAFSGVGEKKDNKNNLTNEAQQKFSTRQYIEENEKRLAEILSAVQGAGKVKTMITVDNEGEKVVAVDKKSENTQENDKEKSLNSSKQEQVTMAYGTGAEEKPFILKEKLPLPAGVLVVATGAGNESVRLEIYEAVKALYGISGHRIKVTKGSIN